MPSALRGVFSVRDSYKKSMGKVQEDRVNVERSMFKAHTFHFLLSSGKACLFPFLTIYFRLLGLTATQVGLVFAGQAFIRLWCAPLWSACAKACRKKKFVLMFSTFILLASSLCLSLAPPTDPENSPLYCKGKLPQVQAEQADEHSGAQEGNATEVFILPSNVTVKPDAQEDVKAENEHAEDADQSPESKELVTTATTTVKSSTTSITTSAPTTTTATTTTTAHHKHGSSGKHGHKDQDEEDVEQLADKLAENGITAEDIDGWSEDDINGILSDLMNAEKEEKDGEGDSISDRSQEQYNYDSKDDSYYYGSQWKSREKRHTEESNEEEEKMTDEESVDKENERKAEKNSEDKEEVDRDPEKSKKGEEGYESNVEKPKSAWDNISEQLGKQVREYRTFSFILGLILVGELLSASVDKLADDSWFEFLDILDVVERYGGHKVWQMMGYALLPAFVGTIVEKTNCILMKNVPHFMIHFFMFAAFAALAFMAAFGYPMSQNKRTPKQSRFGKGVRILCCDIHSLTLTTTILLLGMMYACIQNFLFWKIQDVGGNEIVIGVSIAVASVSSLFMYAISNALVKRITHVGAIVLAMITLAGRLVFYSFLWTPWVVLAGEVLHGFSHTLLWRAVEMYPDFRINPFVMDRSAFTLMNVVYHGLGIGIGSFMSGYLYDQFGFSLLFQGASVVVAAWCAVFLLLQKCVKKKMKVRYAKLLQDDRGVDDSSSDEEDWLEVAMKSGSK